MEKELFSESADEFGAMTLAEAIAWLQGFAENQPCGADEITFRIIQHGDHWDGYSLAQIEIFRDETPEEAAAREAAWAQDKQARLAQIEADERYHLERLKIKYEKEQGTNA